VTGAVGGGAGRGEAGPATAAAVAEGAADAAL
jgi:hypothetical protein